MELADESLADRLKRARAEGKVGLDADNMLRRIVRDAGEALDFLNHRCHILHRDVKPANMLLMGDRLKLCDFGLARMAQNLSPVPSKTLGAGTPVFIAPEIVQGYQSMQSDQYSLAASYCMLRSGRPLFRGTINEIKDQHVHAKPALEQSVFSAGEQRILAKALAKEPTDRFPTSTEFVLELLASIDDHSVGLALPANNSVASLAPPPNSVTVDDGGPAGITSRESQDFKPLKRAHAGKIGSNSTVDLRSSSVPLWAMAVALVVVLLLGFLLGGWVMSLGK
jgi:serine/threonine protein kinase